MEFKPVVAGLDQRSPSINFNGGTRRNDERMRDPEGRSFTYTDPDAGFATSTAIGEPRPKFMSDAGGIPRHRNAQESLPPFENSLRTTNGSSDDRTNWNPRTPASYDHSSGLGRNHTESATLRSYDSPAFVQSLDGRFVNSHQNTSHNEIKGGNVTNVDGGISFPADMSRVKPSFKDSNAPVDRYAADGMRYPASKHHTAMTTRDIARYDSVVSNHETNVPGNQGSNANQAAITHLFDRMFESSLYGSSESFHQAAAGEIGNSFKRAAPAFGSVRGGAGEGRENGHLRMADGGTVAETTMVMRNCHSYENLFGSDDPVRMVGFAVGLSDDSPVRGYAAQRVNPASRKLANYDVGLQQRHGNAPAGQPINLNKLPKTKVKSKTGNVMYASDFADDVQRSQNRGESSSTSRGKVEQNDRANACKYTGYENPESREVEQNDFGKSVKYTGYQNPEYGEKAEQNDFEKSYKYTGYQNPDSKEKIVQNDFSNMSKGQIYTGYKNSKNMEEFERGDVSMGHKYATGINQNADFVRETSFPDCEEPLPCDAVRTNLQKSDGRSDGNVSSKPPISNQNLTNFTKDTKVNQSFQNGNLPPQAKKIGGHSVSAEGRSGSMPYRLKKSSGSTGSPLTLGNRGDDLERDGGNSSRPAELYNEKEMTTTPYDGPRLVPLEKVRGQRTTGGTANRSEKEPDVQPSSSSPSVLAKRLFELDGLTKSDVLKHLGKRSDFSRRAGEAYLRHFDFTSQSVDGALQNFLRHLILSGETQERERVLAHFSQRYLECNPGSFDSEDSCHALVCAIMLLNTDLHGQNIGTKMTVNEFIENLSGMNNGDNFSKDLLRSVYQSIKTKPLEFEIDSVPSAENLTDNNSKANTGENPFLDVPDFSRAKEFKSSYVMRKCCIEPAGHQTPVGKRGWKKLHASLRNMVLYLHKDEHGFSCGAPYDDASNALHVHHSLATPASDYPKKRHVFRLRTANWAEYLFQTSGAEECQSWIDIVNLVAATFSAPPLPGAVGSQVKFQRPLLPSSCTRLNHTEQLAQHEQMLVQLEKDLAEHREFAPEKGSKPRVIQDYLDKETYLEYEQRRFRTYCEALTKSVLDQTELDMTDGVVSLGRNSRRSRDRDSASSESRQRTSPREADACDISRKPKQPDSASSAGESGAGLFRGMHPAASVPTMLFESRV